MTSAMAPDRAATGNASFDEISAGDLARERIRRRRDPGRTRLGTPLPEFGACARAHRLLVDSSEAPRFQGSSQTRGGGG